MRIRNVLVAAALGTALCVGATAGERLDRIEDTKTLRVGTPGDYRPFAMKENGRYVGHDVELLEAMAKAAGWKVEYVDTSWPKLSADFKADKFDVAMGGITPTVARLKLGAFLPGYVTFGKVALVNASKAKQFTTNESLNRPDVRVIKNPGGTNELYVNQHLTKAQVTTHQKNAEIPGGMYSNMVAQLQQLKAEEILPRAMELIPTVRLAAGLPPLVTPTSQIVGAQAVSCALDEKAGRPMYTTKSSQFVALVKGEYGETPVKIDPEFRFKICGVREEIPYDTSKYQMQPNPELPEAGGVKLAANEKEVLLLELFPMVAKTFLTDQKKKAYEATAAKDTPKTAARSEHKVEAKAITGHKVTAPLPGKIIALKVKVGDKVKAGQEVVILEAMKMENSITSDVAGTIKQILVQEGDNVATDAILVEVEE